mgnify:CR=1 FL=1
MMRIRRFELADEVQLAEVPGDVLSALLQALPETPPAQATEAERRSELAERISLRSGLPNLPGLTGLSGKPTLPGLGGFRR